VFPTMQDFFKIFFGRGVNKVDKIGTENKGKHDCPWDIST
jgi:hypothetical protein